MRRYTFRGLITTALLAVSVTGYTYSTFAKWSSAQATIYVNPANADVSSSAAIAAIQYAMNTWNNGGSSFHYQYGGTASDTSNAFDNRNVVIFRNTTSGSAIASTYSWWNSSNQLLDSDVIIWDGGFTFYTGTSGCGGISNSAYLEDIATHELGHALGLNHSNHGDATMYPSYSYCSQEMRTLASDDVNGLKALYPGGGSTNTAPTVSISSPANGASFQAGTSISLVASAVDAQDGNLTSQIQWTDNGTAIGAGGSLSKVLSVPGAHVLMARVTDSGSLEGSAQVSITINGAASSSAPTVTITSPTNGASFAAGTMVTFAATASDAQDGNLTSAIQWMENGYDIGRGGQLSRPLNFVGTRVIVASVWDSSGLQGSTQISITVTNGATSSNTAPIVTISSPANGASFPQGTMVWLTASASDAQDGNLSSQIQWTGNGGVFIGSGPALSGVIGVGTHLITAKVTDSGGLTSVTQVTITITGSSSTAPTVTITSPANGATFPRGSPITFTATASDPQDGDLTSRILWLENGYDVGRGGQLSRSIYFVGPRVITALVWDNSGAETSTQITITITP